MYLFSNDAVFLGFLLFLFLFYLYAGYLCGIGALKQAKKLLCMLAAGKAMLCYTGSLQWHSLIMEIFDIGLKVRSHIFG